MAKKDTTSLSHQSDPSDEIMVFILPELHLTTCPECGKKSIDRIKSDYRTEMGYKIPDLERWHCSSCGADFFDINAMTRMISEGRLKKERRHQTGSKKVLEPKDV